MSTFLSARLKPPDLLLSTFLSARLKPPDLLLFWSTIGDKMMLGYIEKRERERERESLDCNLSIKFSCDVYDSSHISNEKFHLDDKFCLETGSLLWCNSD
ncbi:hypothetical protein L6452_21086 [Arctium lappa]|uniref:Uncharacterized protein n=1 Tax=Arctium lappa TaxID=4217 RepID=A0ACB9BDZ2_ARCLA|nr:hypothetical protein L6452_21086 [Arctium lappa]